MSLQEPCKQEGSGVEYLSWKKTHTNIKFCIQVKAIKLPKWRRKTFSDKPNKKKKKKREFVASRTALQETLKELDKRKTILFKNLICMNKRRTLENE